jgi:hypothetical protein
MRRNNFFLRVLTLYLMIFSMGIFATTVTAQDVNIPEFTESANASDTIICGDVNGLGTEPFGNVTLADYVYLFNYFFEAGVPPVPMDCVADVNGDKILGITDLWALVKYLYKDTDPPVDTCCDSPVIVKGSRDDILGNTGDVTIDDIMMGESIIGSPGMHDLWINVSGSWNSELGAYGVVIQYDTSQIEIDSITLNGTAGEGELLVTNYGWKGYLKAAAALWNKIPPDSGVLFKVMVSIKETAPLGVTNLTLFNDPGPPPAMCDYASSDGNSDILPSLIHGTVTIEWICGDANADADVTIADVVSLVNYLFKSGPEPLPQVCVGDANADGEVTIADAVYLVNYLFGNGPPPSSGCCG